MNRHAKQILFVLGFATVASQAHASILPPNNLNLEDRMELDSSMTESQFNSIIDKVEKYYAPIVAKHGGKLKFFRHWEDSTVNASAIQTGNTWQLDMYGGLARRPEITPDGFTLVICHEMGHHLAGFPFVSEWAANEGQADYFATLSCAHELWRSEGTQNAQFTTQVDAYPKELCDKAWQNSSDRNLCYRSMMAGRSLANLLAQGEAVSFSTPDKKVVDHTDHQHPAAQCRLDTYMAGAICGASFDKTLIPQDENRAGTVSCMDRAKFKTGFRPTCWFKPHDGDNGLPNAAGGYGVSL